MATCALMGQAVGVAVTTAKKYTCSLHGIEEYAEEIQQILRNQDCYLLNVKRTVSNTILTSKNNLSATEKEIFFNGVERALTDNETSAKFPVGKTIEFSFEKTFVKQIRLLFDSDIARTCQISKDVKMYPQRAHVPLVYEKAIIPPRLTKAYTVEIKINGEYKLLKDEKENISRLALLPVGEEISGIRFTGKESYGENFIALFSIDVL